MKCLLEACRADVLDTVDIFTLNHDLVIESELTASGIRFTDGLVRLREAVLFGIPPDSRIQLTEFVLKTTRIC